MAASPLALPSGERRADQSVPVYGILAMAVAAVGVMGALFAAYLVIRQGTPVWPPKGVVNQEYFDNTLAATALMAVLAGWWGLFGVRHGERRQAVLGFSLALFLDGAMINLLTYMVRSSHLSPHTSAYAVIYYALVTAVVAFYVTALVVTAVALGRTLGGQVTRDEPALAWAAGWYGTIVAACYLVMYYLIHVVQ
jgi:heme/copper-type cytochrome/quinol oxidase subunit 3